MVFTFTIVFSVTIQRYVSTQSHDIFLSSDPLEPPNSNDETESNESTNVHHRATELLLSVSIYAEDKKNKISELALEAMEELRRMAVEEGEPLWKLDLDKNIKTLNKIEYIKEFGSLNETLKEILKMIQVGPYEPLPSFAQCNNIQREEKHNHYLPKELIRLDYDRQNQVAYGHELQYCEASRETRFIEKNPVELVEMLMDLVGFHVFSKKKLT